MTKAHPLLAPTNGLRHLVLSAALLFATLASAYAGISQDDLLEPEKAFRISTRSLDNGNVEVRFQIADGYYMYRERFKFETEGGESLADVALPPGVRKNDAFFGETETYRREALIHVPVGPEDVQRGRVKLKVTSQGCADVGVCYTPLEQIVQVSLTKAVNVSTTSFTQVASLLAQSWLQAMLAAAALAILGLSLRSLPALAPWRHRARRAPWFYPALSFAVAALILMSAYPLLAKQVRDLAWGALLIMTAVWLRATDPLPAGAPGTARFAKGVGVLSLAAGIVLLAFAGGWRVPAGSSSAPASIGAADALHFERVATIHEVTARVNNASRPTMLDFYADWCVTCKEMERFTFSDPAVRERMLKMQLLQADVTRNTDADRALLQRFGIFGPPAILFFDEAGNEMRSLRVIGYQSAGPFRSVLDSVLRSADNASGEKR